MYMSHCGLAPTPRHAARSMHALMHDDALPVAYSRSSRPLAIDDALAGDGASHLLLAHNNLLSHSTSFVFISFFGGESKFQSRSMVYPLTMSSSSFLCRPLGPRILVMAARRTMNRKVQSRPGGHELTHPLPNLARFEVQASYRLQQSIRPQKHTKKRAHVGHSLPPSIPTVLMMCLHGSEVSFVYGNIYSRIRV